MCPSTKEIYDIYDTKELKTVSPINSLDVSCYEMSDIEIIPSFELDYFFMLEDIQKAVDVNDHSEDITQFISDATRT